MLIKALLAIVLSSTSTQHIGGQCVSDIDVHTKISWLSVE